jgi:S1-C subfamily serine protease
MDGRLVPGDVIVGVGVGVGVGGADVTDADDLLAALETRAPGERVRLGVLREGQRRDVEVTLDTGG